MECSICKERERQVHFNSKYCLPCALELRRKPESNLTPQQVETAKKLIGEIPREEIAYELGISLSALNRAFKGIRLGYFNKYVANPKLVQKVCAFYEKNGKRKTQEKFPDINVRSIVERYKNYAARQTRWTDDQLIKLARMAGVLPFDYQAKIFLRPRANAGSIRSVWTKNFHAGPGHINGFYNHQAKHFVDSNCPFISVPFGVNRGYKRKLFLWVDMENNLRNDCPDFVKNAIRGMANFQRWLFKSNFVRLEILKMVFTYQKSLKKGGIS